MPPASLPPFRFRLDRVPPGPGPAFRRLARALEGEIRARRAPSGTRLPSVRDLAEDLKVHPSTVRAAYNLLETQGKVVSQVGRGTFVKDAPRQGPRLHFPPTVERALNLASLTGSLEDVPRDGLDLFTLTPNPPSSSLASFQACLERVLREEGEALLSYLGPVGHEKLRAQVARMVSRGERAVDPSEILITSGAQQALELAIQCFAGPGEAVVTPCPTYLNLMGTLEAQGVRLLPVPFQGEELDLWALEKALQDPSARLLYLMPTFQNPTGITVDRKTRLELLDLARRTGIPILEDDLEGELLFEGDLPPSLFSLDREGRVILAGSVSKAFFPGLRVGWLAAPPEAMSRLSALKRFKDLETAGLLQAALAAYLEGGGLSRHLEELREDLKARRDLLVDSLAKYMPEGTRWTLPGGGTSLWVELPPGVDGRDVAAAARRKGVLVAPGDLFFPNRRQTPNLRLSFARARPEKIEEGIALLASLVEERIPTSLPGGGKAPVL